MKKFIYRAEQLQHKLAEPELQGAKDKGYILNVFEENDRKQEILLEEYEIKIEEQENIILTLKNSLLMSQSSLIGEKVSKNTEVQTEPFSTSHAANTPLVIKVGLLNQNYTALEQKIINLEAEIRTINKANSCNFNKTPRGKPNVGQMKNMFSISLQVQKIKDNNLYPAKSAESSPKRQEALDIEKVNEADLYNLEELERERGKNKSFIYLKAHVIIQHNLKERQTIIFKL
ncbi:hypothetical protein J6590_017782 [Homalodisca vitripennis]|nr:hypothetical protein J6590_017782 [Homalodisca vitripennis]